MKLMKEKIAKGKLLWGALAILSFLSLILSVGYYVSEIHGHQVEYAVTHGKHFTLSFETGNVLEESEVQAASAEDTSTHTEETAHALEEGESTLHAIEEPYVPASKVEPETQIHEVAGKIVEAPVAAPTHQAEDKSPPNVHKISTAADSNVPKIALLVSGLGLSRSSTERALALPSSVTLGFSPYSLDIKQWVSTASKDGHDVLINLPLEAAGALLDDPGSFALISNLNAENNLKRLDWVLSRAAGYVGVYSDPHEKFTEIQSSIRPVLKDLKKRGVALVYGAGYSNSSLLQLAKEVSQPMIVNDVVVDTRISADRIREGLEALEHSAKRNGYAVGMGAPYPITIKVIEQWIPTLKEKGIELVPVSVLLQNKKNNPSGKTVSH